MRAVLSPRRPRFPARYVRRATILAAIVLLFPGNPVFAVITGFLPGDACFGSSLSAETLSQFESPEPVIFEYRTGEGAWAGCGYAGYWKLAVRDMPDDMKSNLRKLYGELRKRDPQQIEVSKDVKGNERRREANPYMLLIYNKDYDLQQGIGLKLNEEWMKLTMQKHDKPKRGAYWPYVTDYRAVARDWERGSLVPGLTINEADARPWWGDRIDSPLSVQADQIQIIVLPERLYTSFAFGSSHSSDIPWDELPRDLNLDISGVLSAVNEPHFYRVTSEGVSECHYGEGFVEEPWPLPPALEQANQIEELANTLDRAGTNTFGFDNEQSLPEDVQAQLNDLRVKLDELQEKLTDIADGLRQQPATDEAPDGK